MREKSVIFSTEMVQAILDGRKTMTRRIIHVDISNQFDVDVDGSVWAYVCQETGDSYKPEEIAPWRLSDKLWVRETWAYVERGFGGDAGGYVYRASDNGQLWETETEGWRWRPSIHMPKKAARIWLEVTDVRVERLQDITPNDIAAEGLPSYIIPPGHKHYNNVCGEKWLGYEWFRDLWDSFNSKRGYGWETNPWVWVVEFRRIAP